MGTPPNTSINLPDIWADLDRDMAYTRVCKVHHVGWERLKRLLKENDPLHFRRWEATNPSRSERSRGEYSARGGRTTNARRKRQESPAIPRPFNLEQRLNKEHEKELLASQQRVLKRCPVRRYPAPPDADEQDCFGKEELVALTEKVKGYAAQHIGKVAAMLDNQDWKILSA